MLKITSIQSKDEQEKICKLCGVDYDADTFAYAATDSESGETVGIVQFYLSSDGGHIVDLRNRIGISEPEPLFLAARTVFNFVDLCNIKMLYFSDTNFKDEEFIKKVGFAQDGSGKWCVDLQKFFASSCCT